MAQSTSAQTQAPGGHRGAFPPFQADTFASQLFWLAVTFAFLYLIVARLGLPRVGSTIEARQARIRGDFEDSNRFKSESDAAIAAYEQALTEARSRAQAIANETRERLNAEADKNRKALEGRLHARLADAEKTIAATKASAMANVRGIAIEAAGAIITRLTGAKPAEKAIAAAVDQTLKR